MLKIDKKELRDKIYACWIGKNIGGTLGGPFENTKGIVECDGFVTAPGKPEPNDDLDLQLVWLMAMYEEGPERLNASVLGEYWLEYVVPFWNEYGVGKGNMRNGLVPPMSGEWGNDFWKDSNGAWIRTEVWATLFPGDVDRAVAFAVEDACVDHGMGEGTYAAAFVAAMESAAFFVNDLEALVRIGLSHIPADCRMAECVRTVMACREKGMTWLEARNTITDMALNTEGMDVIGEWMGGWMQAPTNVGYALIGLLWGEGDFKKTMLTACRCGDDTDCTCATVGSLMGILGGTAVIPADWRAHIGDDIVTISLNRAAMRTWYNVKKDVHFHVPETCSALTDEVMALIPRTLNSRLVAVTDGETDTVGVDDIAMFCGDKCGLAGRSGYSVTHRSALADYLVSLDGTAVIAPGEQKTVTLTVCNRFLSQKMATCRWILPEGFTVSGPQTVLVESYHAPKTPVSFTVTAGDRVEPKNMLILQITYDGHHDVALIPVMLLG